MRQMNLGELCIVIVNAVAKNLHTYSNKRLGLLDDVDSDQERKSVGVAVCFMVKRLGCRMS